ncbi:MAG: transposase [Negativicutes bacterium]|nr:transposase [Negativicutes bacterium]
MRKYRKWTIEEKNRHVRAYLEGKQMSEMERELDVDRTVFLRWVRQYRKNGTTVDGRGKTGPRPGRSRNLNPDSMNIEELREYVRLLEDIKKAMAFLGRQRKNIKS